LLSCAPHVDSAVVATNKARVGHCSQSANVAAIGGCEGLSAGLGTGYGYCGVVGGSQNHVARKHGQGVDYVLVGCVYEAFAEVLLLSGVELPHSDVAVRRGADKTAVCEHSQLQNVAEMGQELLLG